MARFLSTPSARRATFPAVIALREHHISIHALREEGDSAACSFSVRLILFLSTPSARRATQNGSSVQLGKQFLSTPSARRATPALPGSTSGRNNFYPRPPRGGRRRGRQTRIGEVYFYPRPPRGGRRKRPRHHRRRGPISIHALREEGDLSHGNMQYSAVYFYPRPPRGGRQQKQRQNLYFQTNYTTFCTNLEEP